MNKNYVSISLHRKRERLTVAEESEKSLLKSVTFEFYRMNFCGQE